MNNKIKIPRLIKGKLLVAILMIHIEVENHKIKVFISYCIKICRELKKKSPRDLLYSRIQIL